MVYGREIFFIYLLCFVVTRNDRSRMKFRADIARFKHFAIDKRLLGMMERYENTEQNLSFHPGIVSTWGAGE